MCEVVMVSENIPKKMPSSKYSVYPGLSESDEDEDLLDILSQSIDIHSDLQYGLLRYRSNTASKLEKIELARKKAGRFRTIKWRNKPPIIEPQVLNELFKKKNKEEISKIPKNQKSTLTETLQLSPLTIVNPYQSYAKYDGNAQVGISTRRYKIYLHMLPQEQRNYPMEVVITVGTKVIDLIGLTLWKCFLNYPDTELKDIEYYALHIAEDNGEVDWDLPNFEVTEYITKFGFGYLALIEKEVPYKRDAATHSSDAVFQSSSDNHSLAPKNGNGRVKCDIGYENLLNINPWHNLEAPLYQSYTVYMLSKLRTKTEILLGVSGEKVEIDPVGNNKGGAKYFFKKKKAATYDIDDIVACDLTHYKTKYATFRLVYDHVSELNNNGNDSYMYGSLGVANIGPLNSHHFKHYDFEVEYITADMIVQKINHILDLRSTPKRKDYLAIRERKSHRRKSFTFGPR